MYEYGHLVRWYIKPTLYKRFLKLKQNFPKNKEVTNSVLCDEVHFVLTILFVLTLASGMAVLYGNDALSILVLSTKKLYSTFLVNFFVF